MTFNDKLKRLEDKISKRYLKLIAKIPETQYYNLFGPYSGTPYIFKASKSIEDGIIDVKSLSILSNLQIAKMKRNNIVETLKAIDYKKQNKKWTKIEKIGFMEEMLRCKFNNQIPNCGIDDYKKQISERYDIPVNTLSSTMSIFITNIRKGLNPDLLDYFGWNELFLYSYRNTFKTEGNNYKPYKEVKLLNDFNNR